MKKSKVTDLRDYPHAKFILVTFEKDKSFLPAYKKILGELGIAVDKKNPLYMVKVEKQGFYFGQGKDYDLEIIVLDNTFIMAVRYYEEKSRAGFLNALFKHVEMREGLG